MRKIALLLATLFVPACAWADDPVIQRVLVEGARTSQLGIADAASAGTVNQKELAMRTVYRPGELLEAAPGLIVSQHSGEGKANQFFLRGFNLDHGTDLATYLDDMPVNQRSHAHGQGWTDLNFLIPELTARLDYKKGPYSAREGDFASAGSAAITYANRLARNVATVGIGQDGHARTTLAASKEIDDGVLTYALEALHNDGPYTHPNDYQKLNGVLRYSRGYANNGWSVTAMAYRGRWNATDQIPERAVAAGLLDRFDAIDTTDGGEAKRFSLSGVWRRTGQDSASKVSAYVIRNQLDLWSDFTYFMNDPVNGDQFAQPDRRVTGGVNATHSWHVHQGETSTSDITVGMEAQNDNVFNGLYRTAARRTLSVTRADHIVETSLGAFIENATRWTPWLRSTVGLRADDYRFRVRTSGVDSSDSLASPSANVVFGPWRQTEFYMNYGEGFHSNDARATLTAPGLVRSRGMELGLRTEAIPKMQSAISLYRLDFDSELTYVGDEGTTEAGPPSRRIGIEFSNYYKPYKWLSVDFDAAYAHARSRGVAPGQDRIPEAIEGVAQLALTVSQVGPWEGALRLRYFGPRPLVEDDSVRSRASTTLNGRLGYRVSRDLRLELEGFNLTNRRASAIDYYYASQLKGEAAPREDVHFHPIEARSFRLTLVRNW
ncbi:TonB-dependent receptor [Telluria mixta]|uniref:TonB-dependent receptor n=1 Tax=Telluria mixta TaxID=34071 RepID=A0ABT2C012_9BURK|nr:TonB-dependent receptor [Telluria mixta]MCS0630730.1 TonB-dependent receptor [Telluria mixta]WEM98734.1 TonB-dependent receptor [Telluria mixta]